MDERLMNKTFLSKSISYKSDDETSSNSSYDNMHTSKVDYSNDCGNINSNNRQNIVNKLLNRERTGIFSNGPRKKVKEIAFKEVPNRLRFCLMDIIPFCYMNNHVFMGLSACGQFLLSYTMKSIEDDITVSMNDMFQDSYKYELYFWIYRPHNLLMKYFNVCLFDDHGVDSIKDLTISQWPSNPRILIVHGSNDFENEHSYISIVSVPKLGCLGCKQLRDEYYTDDSANFNRSAALCIKCNLTIHTKYCRTDSDPKFDPKINLSCPERIIIISNGLIHILTAQLEMNKQLKLHSNSLNILYVNGKNNVTEGCSNNKIQQQQLNLDILGDETINNTTDMEDFNKLKQNELKLSQINNGCELNIEKENIVDRIIADFTEFETVEYPENITKIDNNIDNSNKLFDELVIMCGSSSDYNNSDIDNSINAGTKHDNNTNKNSSNIIDANNSCSNNNNNNNNITNTFTSSQNRVRLLSYRNHRIIKKNVYPSQNCSVTTIELQSSSSTPPPVAASDSTPTMAKSATTINNKILDRAAIAYEFSEDNEKCEKISIFRKRRLADKRYEFSEDNSENIIPFRKLRSSIKSVSLHSKLYPKPSTTVALMSPRQHNSNYYSPPQNSFEITSHTHRASPNHGFRSPCGSPVGYRFMKSPPGRTTFYYSRSPPVPALSPRQLNKRYADLLESPFSSQIDDFDVSKQQTTSILNIGQPLTEIKSSNFENLKTLNSLNEIDKCGTEKEKDTFRKFLVRRYVEEDDATSVITSEEDDCISAGFHTSIPVEVHGACYSDMKMISNMSYQKLKCPAVVITQHTFDLESFSLNVANNLCNSNNIKYGFILDWACDILNVCPISSIITLILMIHFTGKRCAQQICLICTSTESFKCNFHFEHFECRTLFTWNIDNGAYEIVDYGELLEIPTYKRNAGELMHVVKKYANELLIESGFKNYDIYNNLRTLNSCMKKSKEILHDFLNSIEFYRYNQTQSSFTDDSDSYYSDD